MTLWNDLRYAARQLRKSPAFTLTVLATLGLCIGANTAIYTVVDRLFLRPLPYPDPARLVMLASVFQKEGVSDTETSQTGRIWELVRDHATFLDSAVYGGAGGVNLLAAGRVEYVQQQRVSANFFHVLGVAPLFGREFQRQEDVPGGPPLTILSDALWKRDFLGDPHIVGRTVELRGAPYTVIGVMPPTFRTDQPGDLWTPLQPSTSGEGGGDNYGVIARLKPGVTFAQANGQLASVTRSAIDEMHLPAGMTMSVTAIPLQLGLTADLRTKVNLMWSAVGLVLLIGCVNIAGILLARLAIRSREVATRIAIGAGRWKIVRQLLAESVLLAIGGGLTGLLAGYFALNALVRLNPQEFEMWGPVPLDLRVMAVMLIVSLATGILFGLFPAWEATSLDLRSALSEAGRGSSGGRRQWKRQVLVFAEVALGVVLVVGAGLLVRTLSTLMNADPGFNPNHVLTASLSLQDARYQTAASIDRLFRDSLDRIRQIPGVESAAVALSTPYQRPLNLSVQQISGHDLTRRSTITDFAYATPGMFETLQIPLLRGRVFTEADNARAAKVIVVNQAFIRRFLPDTPEPLGAEVTIDGAAHQIIGIVSTVQQKNGWGSEWGPIDAFAQAYVPAAQFSDKGFVLVHTWFSPSWIVRTRGNVTGVQEAMRRALQAVDPRLPFSSFQTMTEVRGKSLSQQRYLATLFSALAALAILLASLGVYGLVAQSVAQRTREMGIRLALGASTKNVIRSAVAPGIVLALAGTAAGLLLSLFATRFLKSLIWGVSTSDPLTFAIVALLLIAIAGLASLIPALRLTHLDPAQTLRNE
jgi:predicted permease